MAEMEVLVLQRKKEAQIPDILAMILLPMNLLGSLEMHLGDTKSSETVSC